ncbi:MAG: hypothetical protein H0U57_13010 [Tatlockia sp.]|nr:hypothetical protein [Tatlockia sp.]
MINEKDISIVVQGPILKESKFGITNNITKTACQRLRILFPESELILSTWKGENIDDIVYDKVILNDDPGATWFNYDDRKHVNNCNRLIVSTLAGIQSASRKYVLKVRSDLFLISKKFLKHFDTFPLYNEEIKFVKSRILAFSMWSIRGHKNCAFVMNKPFHISDWAYFGYKEDLLNLYEVPLIVEPEFSQWFLNRCKNFHDVAPGVLWRMPPEQHITSSFLKKFLPINLEHTADDKDDNVGKSSELLMNNFMVLDQSQFFFVSLKHFCFQFSRENHEWFIYHSTWLKNYCKNIRNLTKVNKLKLNIKIASRISVFFLVNNTLRIINKNKNIISRSLAFFIKNFMKYER